MRRATFLAVLILSGCSFTSLGGFSSGGVDNPNVSDAGAEASRSTDATDEASTDASLSYAALVRADAPIAWWRFEETTGTVAHDEIGGHDATYAGAPVLGVPGIAGGRGVSLGGASRPHATTTSTDIRFPGQLPYTIEVWVMARSMKDYGRIASTEIPSGVGWYMGTDADGTKLSFELNANGTYTRQLMWPGTLSPTRFQHIAIVYDGTTSSMWIDGARVASKSSKDSAPDVGSLTWGCRITSNAVNCADATFDEAAIYARALRDDQIIAHFNAGSR